MQDYQGALTETSGNLASLASALQTEGVDRISSATDIAALSSAIAKSKPDAFPFTMVCVVLSYCRLLRGTEKPSPSCCLGIVYSAIFLLFQHLFSRLPVFPPQFLLRQDFLGLCVESRRTRL